MTVPDDEVFAATAGLRRELADLVESLDDARWTVPSLCAGWSVRDVVGHLVAAVAVPARRIPVALLRAGLRPHLMNTRLARQTGARPAGELARLLRERAEDRASPPVVGARGPLTDLVVHGGDIRLPLGLAFDPPPAATAIALGFTCGGRAPGFVPRGRLAGIRVVAEDLGQSWGQGAELAGRGADLVLAVCGRPEALPALRGAGVEVLRGRLRAPLPPV